MHFSEWDLPWRLGPGTVTVRLALRGRGSIAQLTAELGSVAGVFSVRAGDVNVAGSSEA